MAHLLAKFVTVALVLTSTVTLAQTDPARVLTDVPGFDFSRLPAPARKELASVLTDEFDSCGRPLTLLASLKKGDACKHTRRMVGYAATLAADGVPATEIIVALSKYNQGFNRGRASFKYDERLCLGPKDAKVTIAEFSDFECPFCGRVEPTITQLMRDYGNDLRVVWMNNPLPFHQNATPAANAALEAMQQGGSAKFWAMHEKLFSNQQGLTRENMERYAQELGLNMAQFRAALDNNEHRAAIEQQQTLARGLGASGTPSFFINGRNLRGAQPIEAFKAVIDEELRKARTLVQQGTPRAQVYARTIANGATAQVMLPGAAPSAQPAQPQQPPPDQVYNIPVPRTAPSKGPANAQVTIQLFSDFQCPFCSRVNPTLEQVEREYGNRVRIVWRDYPLPFHQNAMPAAIASREVFRQGGNAKFWAYHALLFQNQQDLSRATLERLAQQVGGINMQQFRAALDGNTHQAAVQADMDAVRQAGAQIGTPSSFINGRLLQGAQPFEAFKAAIDRALAERH